MSGAPEELPGWAREALGHLGRIGLDAHGVADGAGWEHVLPGCRAVLVVGSGGTALWEAFAAAVGRSPALAERPDPLDAFVRDRIEALPEATGRRWLRCAGDEAVHVDFRTLAHRAGLGHPSRLGLILHPEHGPWLGLRAACFTTEPLPVTGPLPGPGPCEGCPAPCQTACPVGAISPEGWAWEPCVSYQREADTCQGGCLARGACVVGRHAAYGPDQHRYHQHGPSRDAVLRALRTRT